MEYLLLAVIAGLLVWNRMLNKVADEALGKLAALSKPVQLLFSMAMRGEKLDPEARDKLAAFLDAVLHEPTSSPPARTPPPGSPRPPRTVA